MGSNVSRLEIQFDEEPGQNELLPLPAGSLLKGKIVTELTQPQNAPKSSEIVIPAVQLQFYGKEKVRMGTKAKKTSGTSRAHASKAAERQILDLRQEWPSFPVEEDAVTVRAGTYMFPFSIELPRTLPSSTYYPMNENRKRANLRFRIQYKLSVKVNLGPKTSKKVTRYIWIKAAAPYPPRDPVPSMIKPVAHELKGGGLFKRGTFLLGAAVDNCYVSSALNLHVACRNDSSVNIQRVQVRVLERLDWGTTATTTIDLATGVATKSTTTLHQTDVNTLFILEDIQLPGLNKVRKGGFKSAIRGIIGDQKQNLERQIYEDLISGENLIRIQLPDGARESYVGQLLKVSHFVNIEFFASSFFVKNPVVEIPIHIEGVAQPMNAQHVHEPAVPSGAGEAYLIAPPRPFTALTTGVTDTENEPFGGAPRLPSIEEPVTAYESEVVFDGATNSQRKMHLDMIPLASAQALPMSVDAVAASMISSPSVIVLGGDAILCNRESRRLRVSLSDLVPVPPPNVISVPSLLTEMRSSINDFELISDKLLEPEWSDLFRTLSPDDFGSILSCVHVDFDQPRVALLLAPHLQNGLSCEHIVAALRKTSEQHRAVMAQRLLPSCVDASVHHDLIRAELNEWEIFQCSGALEDAAVNG